MPWESGCCKLFGSRNAAPGALTRSLRILYSISDLRSFNQESSNMKHAILATLAAAMLCLPANGQRSVTADEVLKVDEQFRLAKLNRDTRALGLILAESFHETNQNGNSRNKAQTIQLWASFAIESLTTDSADVKITGDTAVVTGSQTEHN